jgi:RNA polymerase primary sigma factor
MASRLWPRRQGTKAVDGVLGAGLSSVDRAKDKSLNPLLRMAAITGEETAVRFHIGRGDDLDAGDGTGMTPLMLTVSKNRSSVCALLIEAGADLELCDPSGRDALSIALATRATETAEILSASSAQLKPVDEAFQPHEVETPVRMELVSLDDD